MKEDLSLYNVFALLKFPHELDIYYFKDNLKDKYGIK